ncbi:MAG: single-stranded DNA-binding protein [bacterium]
MVNLKMPDINCVMIAGNLTNEPFFRKTSNGTPVANFYIASNRKFKDNAGQWRENVCFIGVVAWHRLAESCYEFLKKGSPVLVEGELQSRSWKNEDGSNNNVVEIKARRIQFLSKLTKKEDMTAPVEEGETVLTEFEQNGAPSEESQHMNESEHETKEIAVKDKEVVSSASEFNFGYEESNL